MPLRRHIVNQKDFAAGVIYALIGGGFAVGATTYKVGDAARMGPGWFPLAVGVLLGIVGLVNIVRSIGAGEVTEPLKLPELSSMAWVLGAVVLFALLLQPAGLVVALAALVIVSSRGSHEFSWKATLINTVFLVIFSVLVFVEGIDMQIALWPAFID